jgi:hypothetical protein
MAVGRSGCRPVTGRVPLTGVSYRWRGFVIPTSDDLFYTDPVSSFYRPLPGEKAICPSPAGLFSAILDRVSRSPAGQWPCRHAIESYGDGQNIAFGIKFHPFNANHPVIPVSFLERPPVVYNIILIFTGYLKD